MLLSAPPQRLAGRRRVRGHGWDRAGGRPAHQGDVCGKACVGVRAAEAHRIRDRRDDIPVGVNRVDRHGERRARADADVSCLQLFGRLLLGQEAGRETGRESR